LIFINFRALLDREGAWGIFYSIESSQDPEFLENEVQNNIVIKKQQKETQKMHA
jgi:hypothetical protein